MNIFIYRLLWIIIHRVARINHLVKIILKIFDTDTDCVNADLQLVTQLRITAELIVIHLDDN